MRPFVMTTDSGYQPDSLCALYVKRDEMRPQAWRLAWMRPGASSFSYSEGECSAVYHRTMGAAVAYGERHYRERAKRFPR